MSHYELVVRTMSPDEVTLDFLAAHSEMHPELVARLVEFGLIQPVGAQGSLLLFDSSKISRVCSIRRLRAELGINLQGVAVVLDLVERLRELERENVALRARL
jgi:hypothetical protein